MENTQTWEEFQLKRKNDAIRWLLVALLAFTAIAGVIFVSVFLPSCEAFAGEIPEELAIACILGESRGEGYDSMLAHSEALRARGSIQGVYGCKVRPNEAEAKYIEKTGILALARKAWKESEHTNTVKGASFWGSLIVDKAWIAKMERSGYVRTAVIKNTAFYRKG